jgi:hypothetical protein
LRSQAQDPVIPSRACHGGRIGGAPLDPHSGGLDPEPPVAGRLVCRWRSSHQTFFPSSDDRGGRGWRGRLLLLSIGAAVSLLLPPLRVACGGEGLGVKSGDAAAGGNPWPSPSSGRGVVELSGKVASAWYRGLPGSDIKAPPQISSWPVGFWTSVLNLRRLPLRSLLKCCCVLPPFFRPAVVVRGRVAATRLDLGGVLR